MSDYENDFEEIDIDDEDDLPMYEPSKPQDKKQNTIGQQQQQQQQQQQDQEDNPDYRDTLKREPQRFQRNQEYQNDDISEDLHENDLEDQNEYNQQGTPKRNENKYTNFGKLNQDTPRDDNDEQENDNEVNNSENGLKYNQFQRNHGINQDTPSVDTNAQSRQQYSFQNQNNTSSNNNNDQSVQNYNRFQHGINQQTPSDSNQESYQRFNNQNKNSFGMQDSQNQEQNVYEQQQQQQQQQNQQLQQNMNFQAENKQKQQQNQNRNMQGNIKNNLQNHRNNNDENTNDNFQKTNDKSPQYPYFPQAAYQSPYDVQSQNNQQSVQQESAQYNYDQQSNYYNQNEQFQTNQIPQGTGNYTEEYQTQQLDMEWQEIPEIDYDYIQNLQRKRKIIEQRQAERKKEFQQNKNMYLGKIEKTMEYLISEKVNFEKRNQIYRDDVKKSVLKFHREMGKVYASDESLIEIRQCFLDYLKRNNPQLAKDWEPRLKSDNEKFEQRIDRIRQYGPQVIKQRQDIEKIAKEKANLQRLIEQEELKMKMNKLYQQTQPLQQQNPNIQSSQQNNQ